MQKALLNPSGKTVEGTEQGGKPSETMRKKEGKLRSYSEKNCREKIFHAKKQKGERNRHGVRGMPGQVKGYPFS